MDTTPSQPQQPDPFVEQTPPVEPQPQPHMQPVETTPLTPTPVYPPVPSTSPASPIAPAPVTKESPAKLIIIIFSIVAGLILLAIIAIVIYFVAFAVTPKDYQQAAATSDAVTAKITAAEDAVTSSMTTISSTSTTADISSKIADAQTSLDSLKSANATLAPLKALRNKDVKNAYDAYLGKYNSFSAYVTNFLASYKKIAPAIAEANVVSNDTDQAAKLADAQKVQSELANAQNVPDKDFATYALDAAAAYQTIIDSTKAYNQATTYSQLSAAQNNYYDALTKLEDVSNTFEANTQKHAQAVDPSSAYNTFVDTINSKIKS